MDSVLKFLSTLLEQRFRAVLLVLGVLAAALASVRIDKARGTLDVKDTPSWPLFIVGCALLLAGILAYLFGDEGLPAWSSSVRREANGYRVALGTRPTSVHVRFGKLEDLPLAERTLVVLPANEFFDDECINDTASALGGFAKTQLGANLQALRQLLEQELRSHPATTVRTVRGTEARSYGPGHCVILDPPFRSEMHLALVAVTTHRPPEGLHARIPYVLTALENVVHEMAARRFTTMSLPLLGAGHGGLRSKIALQCILLGLAELLRTPPGNHVQDVNVVVYQASRTTPPVLSRRIVRRALALAAYSTTPDA